MSSISVLAWILLLAGPAPQEFDRAAAGERTLEHLSALIAIDTTNAPGAEPDDDRPNGNELATARYFEAQLAGIDGVETHVLEAAPGRANFVAVLRAPEATSRPVLVMGHMDVVGADPDTWSTPPFEPTLKDGFVHGRGAIDCKGPLAAELTAFVALAGERERLRRDVVLLATAAEEGGPRIGIDWVLEHHRDLLGEVEFALNEGGRIRLGDGGEVRSVNVQVTEKLSYNVRVQATGPSGHGSVPLPENALAALARAVARAHDLRLPVRMLPTTRLFFERSALIEEDSQVAAAMRAVAAGQPGEPEFDQAAELLSEQPAYNAVLRTACSLTRLDGGFRNNVIPSVGTAVLNTRVIPGDDVLAVVDAMAAWAAEPTVRFSLTSEPREPPPPSPVDTELYLAMEEAAAEMAPGAVVIPFLSTGGTDGAALRRLGIPVYGILPIPLQLEDELRMHGDDERAPIAGLGWAAEYIWRTLRRVSVE